MTAQCQKTNSQLKSIINNIEAGKTRAGYELQDSLLMYVGPQRIVRHLCVPISDLPAVFHNIHNNASHFSFTKTSLGWKPRVIVTDSDKRFVGATGQQFASSIESTKDWVNILPAAELTINSTPSLTTGQAPFDLVYIARPNPPVLPSVSDANMEDRLAMAKARLDSAWQTALKHSDENKTQYDVRHKPLHILNVGDSQGIACFEVEAIVGQQCFRGYVQYHIKWQGDPHTTWEFEEDLLEDGCAAAIQEWHHKQGLAPTTSAHALDTSLSKHPIAFIFTTTSPADSKLLGLELEISCLAWAVHCLQHFLEGAIKITVVTDHAPLGAVLQAHSPSMHQFTPCIE
ncbi:uncharacterized protein UBRO_21072 [Ustilago bromivora]|uniref:Chromo domain-containing protein n=1 Tax=Ustilago bromivora TaxID=307758 RepID=A0A1K0G6V8_9BASI|nr:uncharacterized protein UBRO_21072 [Ustilago bromivora]